MNITNKEQLTLIKKIKPYTKIIAETFLSKYYLIWYNSIFVIENRWLIWRWYWYWKTITDIIWTWEMSQEAKKKWLVDNFWFLLLKLSAQVDEKNKKIISIYDQELYSLLMKAKKWDKKLYELIEWLVNKLLLIIQAVINSENQTIANGVISYNPNTTWKKLINAIIKNYKELINNKYITYSNILKNK